MKRLVRLVIVLALTGSALLAQRYGRRGGGWGGGEGFSEDAPFRTAREAPTHSYEMPLWTNTPGFEKDVFTFVRLRYHRGYRSNARRAGNCFTDFPDSDLNLSYRFQQLTSMKVDPDGRVVSITDPELFNYPFVYMVEPGALEFSDDEVPVLRRYLSNGGFLMADDFWGTREWENFENQMKRVFPERSFVELPMDHPVFHTVFQLNVEKDKLQVPNFVAGEESQYNGGITWENHDGEECRDMHVRALLDDRGRIMAIACHNSDNGDGWEREQEYGYFFREFSEKRAYPLGINIIVYAMTH